MPWSGGRDLVARWWAGEAGTAGVALDLLGAPLEWAYRSVMAVRNAAYDRGVLSVHAAGVPVISVGNLSVGGSGKTPVAAWLLAELLGRGRQPALLHGGYAADEPELHRRWSPGVPVAAGRDRVASAAAAVAGGADVLVLDDAFQHRRIARDLDLLLVGAEQYRGRRHLLPRGGWREPLTAAARASLIAVTRRTASAEQAAAVAAELAGLAGRPVVRIELRSAGWQHEGVIGSAPAQPALAVAAVADPAAFVANARGAGALVEGELCWPDHHDYSPADAALISARAGAGAIVTTAKDWVKLERLLPAERVWVLQQEVVIEAGGSVLTAALDRVLGT